MFCSLGLGSAHYPDVILGDLDGNSAETDIGTGYTLNCSRDFQMRTFTGLSYFANTAEFANNKIAEVTQTLWNVGISATCLCAESVSLSAGLEYARDITGIKKDDF